jgi:ubiquinone/menaquinone biosynthesis C-methylase UbiE
MTEGPNPEYVTDVTYVRSFEPDLSPTRLRLVAALNGFRAPPSDDFDYCELGCAHGDTTAALAAAFPHARFVGIDLNPEHIATARALARGGELTNVRFLEIDFENLPGDDLPEFDFIGAHGVLSWVGPQKRKAIVDFARAKLKPGGLLHVSYNALPGWAAVEPLRQLILGRAELSSGNSLERAKEGVRFAKLMEEAGAEYFKRNPAAKAMLLTMEEHGLPYVVHEYLHAHWVPMYFAQVASEMAASDLYFVGQLPLYLNYRDIAIPQSLADLFRAVGDRITFESLKDFANNEYFRRDIYMKGRSARSEEATRAYLESTPFGTLLGEGRLERDIKLPHHTLHFVGEVFDVLLPALEQGASTIGELVSRPDLRGFGVARIREAMVRLAIGGQVSAMQASTKAAMQASTEAAMQASTEAAVPVSTGAPPSPEPQLLHVPSPFNRWALKQGLSNESPVVLASFVAGTAFEVPLVEAVAMILLTEVVPDRRKEWVHALCQKDGFRLSVNARRIESKEEEEHVLLAEVDRFRARKVNKMLELGILAVA